MFVNYFNVGRLVPSGLMLAPSREIRVVLDAIHLHYTITVTHNYLCSLRLPSHSLPGAQGLWAHLIPILHS